MLQLGLQKSSVVNKKAHHFNTLSHNQTLE